MISSRCNMKMRQLSPFNEEKYRTILRRAKKHSSNKRNTSDTPLYVIHKSLHQKQLVKNISYKYITRSHILSILVGLIRLLGTSAGLRQRQDARCSCWQCTGSFGYLSAVAEHKFPCDGCILRLSSWRTTTASYFRKRFAK